MPVPRDFTEQLRRADPDDPRSFDDLIRLSYDELRRIAHNLLRGERRDHTLQTTDLVHESFLKFTGLREMDWQDRGHYYAFLTRSMKQVLVDHARARKRLKRGGDAPHISIDDAAWMIAQEQKADEILAITEALDTLGDTDPEGRQVFELKYYMGMSHREIADLLGVSTKTVQRKLRHLEAWIKTHFLSD